MKRDDRDKHGAGGDEDRGKVVRLPRDWLGPRSELVPFGPSAEARERAAAATKRGETGARDDVVLQLAPPPEITQDDFWGGALDSIPRPIVGPVVRAREEDGAAAPKPRDRAATAGSRGADPAAPAGSAAPVRDQPPPPESRPAVRPRAGRGRVPVRAIALAAAGLMAITVTVDRLAGPNEHRSSGLTASRSSRTLSLSPRDFPAKPALTTPRSQAPRRASRTRTAHHRAAVSHHHSSSITVSYDHATTASASSSPAPAAASGSTSTGYAQPSYSKTTERSATETARPKNGPVGPNAPFTPGRLG